MPSRTSESCGSGERAFVSEDALAAGGERTEPRPPATAAGGSAVRVELEMVAVDTADWVAGETVVEEPPAVDTEVVAPTMRTEAEDGTKVRASAEDAVTAH